MRSVKVTVNGKETEGIVVEKIYKTTKRRIIRGKEYRWEERYIHVFLPKSFQARKLLVVKADDINV